MRFVIRRESYAGVISTESEGAPWWVYRPVFELVSRFHLFLTHILELALNLAWLGISVLLLVIGVSHVARGGEYGNAALAAVAMLCLVCLLFPVISMTDDLNSGGPAMVEPGKLKRIVQSVPVVLTLLSWAALQAPPDNCWAAIEQQPEIALPSQEGFSFGLSRRPPPKQLSLV